MSNENDKSDIQKDYSKIINNNSIIKHYGNAMSRFLILWIINYNESIHGFRIFH